MLALRFLSPPPAAGRFNHHALPHVHVRRVLGANHVFTFLCHDAILPQLARFPTLQSIWRDHTPLAVNRHRRWSKELIHAPDSVTATILPRAT